MNNLNSNRERRVGILNFVLFAMPLVGILAILISKNESRNMKIAAVTGTTVGLFLAVVTYL